MMDVPISKDTTACTVVSLSPSPLPPCPFLFSLGLPLILPLSIPPSLPLPVSPSPSPLPLHAQRKGNVRMHNKKDAIWKPGREALPETNFSGSLIFIF